MLLNKCTDLIMIKTVKKISIFMIKAVGAVSAPENVKVAIETVML